MNNQQIADIFGRIADLLGIRGDSYHRILAYRRASENIESWGQDLSTMLADGSLTTIPGIGETLADKIEEMLTTGKLGFYERLTDEIPESLIDVLRVDGVGPKKAKLFYDKLEICSIAELKAAAEGEQLRALAGMGAKSEAKILAGIAALERHGDRRTPLGEALPIAEGILATLAAVPGVTKTAIGGSLRRRRDDIGDIDLLVAADEAGEVMDTFGAWPDVEEVVQRGPTKMRVMLRGGIGVDLRVLPAERWGTLLSYFTGSQAHNIRLRELALQKGYHLNEHAFTPVDGGEEILCADEEAVYAQLGLPYIPAALREDRGEIEAAEGGMLPQLIKREDIISDLHMHTTWSDGKQTVLEMAQAAYERGYEYIVITDHSQSLGIANGLTPERVREQRAEIEAAQAEMGDKIRIFQGTEMEIKADGSLDFPDELLAELDFVIASLHVSLRQNRDQIMNRFLAAVHNPHVDMIAHPTGRLLPERPGADVDMEELFREAAAMGTILEINANPRRLDLRDSHIRRAREHRVVLAINCDAHAREHFDLLNYGVETAQRGWATPADIINSWPLAKFERYLQTKLRED
ncbi:MAG TPA: DNA polymerase/3'-5' exonuclease PolX [Anaerolineae bacterium]|nr:DNA polymerase/3'-5' exonuclease PolX [Anaerolineae bacterium]